MKNRFSILIALALIGPSVQAQTAQELVGQTQRLTPEDQYFMRPSWSPDGQSIAFTTRNHDGIWVLDITSQEISQVVTKPGSGYQFAWSPDGQSIAYRARDVVNRRSRFAVEVVEIASGEARLVKADRFLGTPHWARDGSTLYFVAGGRLIRSAPLQDTAPLLEKPAAAQEHIAFVMNRMLHISDVSDTLRQEGPLLRRQILNPSLSPGGDRVLYEEVAGDVIIQDLESRKKTSLGPGHRPQWSPDGAWVCFMISEDDGHQYMASDIWVVRADGKERLNLTDSKDVIEMNPAWSPDGQAIAYDERRSGAIMTTDLHLQ